MRGFGAIRELCAWFRWIFAGHRWRESAEYRLESALGHPDQYGYPAANLPDRIDAIARQSYESLAVQLEKMSQLEAQLAEQQQQLAKLRAILTARPVVPETKIARRFSEVRAALQQGDEDAA